MTCLPPETSCASFQLAPQIKGLYYSFLTQSSRTQKLGWSWEEEEQVPLIFCVCVHVCIWLFYFYYIYIYNFNQDILTCQTSQPIKKVQNLICTSLGRKKMRILKDIGVSLRTEVKSHIGLKWGPEIAFRKSRLSFHLSSLLLHFWFIHSLSFQKILCFSVKDALLTTTRSVH